MRALFCKDFNQGRPILLTALLLALLAPAGLWVLDSPRFLYLISPDVYLPVFMVLIAVLPAVMGLFAGAGLFATERENNTLPVLLSLPVSRWGVWTAKALAGLAITYAAAAIIFVLDVFVFRNRFSDRLIPLFWSYLPDIAMWAFVTFSVAVFWSALTPNLIASLSVTLVALGGMIGGVCYLIWGLGAPLLGYPPEMDVALWAALSTPSLLAGSALAFSKGRLLQSPRRKYPLAFACLLVGLPITIGLAVGIVRAATKYRRSEAAEVRVVSVARRGSAAVLDVRARPREFARKRLEMLLPTLEHTDTQIPREWGYAHDFQVAIDLDTGRELVVQRVPLSYSNVQFGAAADCSPDGRLLATAVLPMGLTYGALPNRRAILRIWDLKKGTVIFSREMEEWEAGKVPRNSLSWSPSGKYLLVQGEINTKRYLVNADGSGWREISVASAEEPVLPAEISWRGPHARKPPKREHLVVFEDCQWARREDVLWAKTKKGKIYRLYPDGRTARRFYAPEQVGEVEIGGASWISPDDEWVAIEEWRHPASRRDLEKRRLIVVRADGSESHVIWEGTIGDRTSGRPYISGPRCWSAEGHFFYVETRRLARDQVSGELRTVANSICVWRPGQSGLRVITSFPESKGSLSILLFPVPDSDQMLVFVIERRKNSPWGFSSDLLSARAFFLSPDGRTRPFSPAGGMEGLSKKFWPEMVDERGRVILHAYDWSEVSLLDIRTGKITTVYP